MTQEQPPSADDANPPPEALAPSLPLIAFLERVDMEGLDLQREPDTGREIEF